MESASESYSTSIQNSSFLISCLIHIFILFIFGNKIVEEARYGIVSGPSKPSVDVELEAPPVISLEVNNNSVETQEIVQPITEPEPKTSVTDFPVLKRKTKIKANLASKENAQKSLDSSVESSEGIENKIVTAAAGFDISAAYLQNPPPLYPHESRRLKEEGLVLLTVEINRDGHVDNVTVKDSSGYSRLDYSAIKAVQSWIFKPTKVAGITTKDTVEVPIRFTLK